MNHSPCLIRLIAEALQRLLQGRCSLGIKPFAQLNGSQFVEIGSLAGLRGVGLLQLHQPSFITTHTQQLSAHHHRNDGKQADQSQQIGLGQQIHESEVSSWLR